MSVEKTSHILFESGIDAGFYRHLERRLFEITSLYDVSQALNSALDLNSSLEAILLTAMGKFASSRGMIFLKDGSQQFQLKIYRGNMKDVHSDIKISYRMNSADLYLTNTDDPNDKFFVTHDIDLICPIQKKEIIGLLCLGNIRKTNRRLDKLDSDFILSLAQLAATAIENVLIYDELKSVNRKLDLTIQELNTLFEISNELNSNLDTDQILKVLTLTLMGQMMISKSLVIILDEKSKPGFRLGIQRGSDPARINNEVIAAMNFIELMNELDSITYINNITRSDIKYLCEDLGICLLIPMQIKNVTKGIMGISAKKNQKKTDPFTENELVYLSTLANQCMVALENARLFQVALEKEQMERELDLAKTIQQDLLPAQNPQEKGYDIAGINLSCLQVGGDYYDYIQLPDSRIGLAIADVTGKSVPAALLMANLSAYLRAYSETVSGVKQIVSKLNTAILNSISTSNKFITFFYGELDTVKKTFTYSNAGHNYPIIFRKNNDRIYLNKGGLILGLFPMAAYEEETIQLESGDLLIMYTDGVSEALNEIDEDYGEERLENFILNHVHLPAMEIIQNLLSDITSFTRGFSQSDDITIVIVKIE